MSSRPDNVACFAVRPALSLPASAEAMMSCKLSDHEWVAAKYVNFRQHVRSLVPREPALSEWSLWLDELPLRVFLAGGDHELAGVRGAPDSDKRAAEADLVLERWALQYGFELSRICDTDIKKLQRYIVLFSAC